MSARALGRRVADLARRQAEAAERHATQTAAVDAGHAKRVAFLMMVPEDLRMAVGIALCDPVRGEYLADWTCWPFARWATVPAEFQFPRSLVEWLLNSPHSSLLGHHCERCGLGVPLRVHDSRDPNPPPTLVVFPTCPVCGGRTTFMGGTEPGRSAWY